MTEKVIRTVCGDIDPDDLGLTDSHEHLMGDYSDLIEAQSMYKEMIPEDMLKMRPENMAFLRMGTSLFSDDCQVTNDVDWLKFELEQFRDRVGGGCVVDASPIPMRADAKLLRKASAETGVNIICTTGFYYELARAPKLRELTESQVYDICMDEVQNGIAGSEDENGVRVYPGFVKCGMSASATDPAKPGGDIAACEWETLAALARISSETGLSLHVHSAKPMTKDQVIQVAEFALDHGCKPERLNMMHMDQYVRDVDNIWDYVGDYGMTRNVDITLQETLLKMGCYIGWDGWGVNEIFMLPDNYDRTKGLIELMHRGYASQIVLGHDITDRARSASGGGWGFSDFVSNLIPKLYEYPELVDPDEIDYLIYDNPARLFAFEA